VKQKLLNLLNNRNFLSLAGNMTVAVFGFISFVILVRILDPDHFGEWVLYITAGNFIEMLRFGITRTAIIRFLSGARESEREKLIGSNWLIGLVATLLIAFLLYTVYFLFTDTISSSGFSLFFLWYPILGIINLPFNNALSVLQADQEFGKILYIRLVNTGGFVLLIIISLLFFDWGLMGIVYIHLLINLITSIWTMAFKWDGLKMIFKANSATNKMILDFGKYTTGTLIGSNLLKSSDTFLIGLSPFLGTTGVAFYSVPLKLTEILEIPLRSFVATAFPRMSKASIDNNIAEVKKIYYTYTGGLTYLLIPIIVAGFIFAEEFVVVLGGIEYIETAMVFRIFCIYGLFLPIDKFTGVALDSINKPRSNFYKVMYMAAANIAGDSIVIFLLSRFLLGLSLSTLLIDGAVNLSFVPAVSQNFAFMLTLELVAVVTIIFTLIGILVGLNYLDKEIGINFKSIFTEGWKFFGNISANIKRLVYPLKKV